MATNNDIKYISFTFENEEQSDISPNDVEVEITTHNQYKIAEYKFNNTIYNLFPEFNTEFTDYTYEDIVDGEVTTRTIISDDLPTIVRFGTGNASSTNRENSLLEILELKTDNLITMSYMFANCENLTYINSSNWNTSNVTEMIWLFVRCRSLRTIEGINNWDTKKVTNMDSVFSGCRSLTSLDLSNWNTTNVEYIEGMFTNCSSLTSLDLSNWNTSQVTNMNNMFEGCSSLTTLDLSNFDTSNVTSMNNMIRGCHSLTSLDVSNFNTSNVTNMRYMFEDCHNITSLDLSNFDTSKVTNMTEMINECYALTKLNISNWHLNSEVDVTDMFKDTNVLTNVTMNNSDYNSVNKIISKLPTRTTLGYMYISRDILNNANISEAESKMWRILPLGGRVKNVYINGNNISNMITKQNKKIKGIYLGNTPLL